MRRVAALVFVSLLAGVGLADVTEQAIVPLDGGEQRVEAVDVANAGQNVEQLTTDQVAEVTAMQPRSTAARVALAAGKVAVGISAAAFAVGFTVASLMFF
jgi:hypothetical protein